MDNNLLFRTAGHVIYDMVTCPRCGHVGCESYNASMPMAWHCPRCDEKWNPDNLHMRPEIGVGSDITVGDLRLGDVVVYLLSQPSGKMIGYGTFTREEMRVLPNSNPYSQMSVVKIDNYGVTLQRPYIHIDRTEVTNGEGKWYPGSETVHFRFDSSMPFRLIAR